MHKLHNTCLSITCPSLPNCVVNNPKKSVAITAVAATAIATTIAFFASAAAHAAISAAVTAAFVTTPIGWCVLGALALIALIALAVKCVLPCYRRHQAVRAERAEGNKQIALNDLNGWHKNEVPKDDEIATKKGYIATYNACGFRTLHEYLNTLKGLDKSKADAFKRLVANILPPEEELEIEE